MKYVCPCGYVYDPAVGDPDNGIAPGTPWEEVPADWTCPVCGLENLSRKNKPYQSKKAAAANGSFFVQRGGAQAQRFPVALFAK